MNNVAKWSPNGNQNREQVDQKRGPKIDAKKGPHARTRPEGRQVGRAPLIKTKSPFLVSFSPRPRFVLI